MEEIKFYSKIAAGIVLFMLVVIVWPFITISVGEKGIVLRQGAINRTLDEGFHTIVPLVESVVVMDVTTQLEEVDAQAASKDMQTVSAKISINYSLDKNNVVDIYTKYRTDVQTTVIAPAVQEALKAATAKYTAEELITKRESVRADIVSNLTEKVKPAFVTVEAVSIRDFDFSPSFNQAIEEKVKAEQIAQTEKNNLEAERFKAEQVIVKAKAAAESIRLQSDAANNEKYVSLKRVEVEMAKAEIQKEMAQKWDGKLPVNMYSGAPLPLLNLTTEHE